MNTKKALIGGLLVGALTIGAVSVSAQPRGGGPGGDRPLRDLVALVAEATGLEPREVAQELRGGATIAELITANGGDVQVVTDTIIASLTDRINTAVENGRVTEEQASELIAGLNDRVTAALNGEYEALRPFAGGGRGDRGGELGGLVRGASPLVNAISEATGLDQREILEAVIGGSTLGEIVTNNGGDIEAVVADAVAQVTERVSQAVERGRITQEEADARIAEFEAGYRALLNGELPAPFAAPDDAI